MDELKYILYEIQESLSRVRNNVNSFKKYPITTNDIEQHLFRFTLEVDHYYWQLNNLSTNIRALRDKLEHG